MFRENVIIFSFKIEVRDIGRIVLTMTIIHIVTATLASLIFSGDATLVGINIDHRIKTSL